MIEAAALPIGPPPVAIGGVGGSGTRLVAELLRASGVHLGSDLNSASDALWFTMLFKRIEILGCSDREFECLVDALVSGLCGGGGLTPPVRQLISELCVKDRPQHPAQWLKQRATSLFEEAGRDPHSGRWGWKEPNTHVVIERLWTRMPHLHYIHVVRHGVDMAYSTNQNQLQLWGERVLGGGGPVTPQRSLAYWCRVHQRMQDLLKHNHTRMYWLDYDRFCRDPAPVLSELASFLAYSSREELRPVTIRPPPVRHLLHDTSGLDCDDLAYVRSLGYAI